jgi:hypothetical protein
MKVILLSLFVALLMVGCGDDDSIKSLEERTALLKAEKREITREGYANAKVITEEYLTKTQKLQKDFNALKGGNQLLSRGVSIIKEEGELTIRFLDKEGELFRFAEEEVVLKTALLKLRKHILEIQESQEWDLEFVSDLLQLRESKLAIQEIEELKTRWNEKINFQIDALNPRLSGESMIKVITEFSRPAFSDDFPQKGFVHKVDKGETVSSIAQKYNSRVKWIIDANLIFDPIKVFEGKELFIPTGTPTRAAN